MSTALPSPTFRDSQSRKRLRGADLVVRAAVCELLRAETRPSFLEPIADVVARTYGSDGATLAYLQRAAVAPANTTTATWAAELVSAALGDFLGGPQGTSSAFAGLSARAMNVSFPPGVGQIKIPSRSTPQTLVGSWIGESGAKPVTIIPLATTSLTNYKLAAISMFSEELLQHSTPSIETVVTSILRHDLGALLDSALLDAAAASSPRSAGLFNGATAVTASAATPASEAMLTDLKALTAAVMAGNPDASLAFVVNPAQALRLNTLPQPLGNVIVSGWMTAGSVGVIDASAVAVTATAPVFAQSRNAALHAESVPLPLSAPGSPNVVAAPMNSMFQSDSVALRSVLRAGWIKCRASAAAIVTGATW